jgi:ubiquinone/menaquinone biosynthesis C-methylase UbiE
LQCLSSYPAGKKVLDLGCGESILSVQAAALGYKVTGIDFRPYPYFHPNLEFIQGDVSKLPFPDESYDIVFCVSTIEHIGVGFYADPTQSADHKTMTEAYRVLKPGGTLVVTTPYGVSQVNSHQRVYDKKSLAELLQKFQIKELRYFVSQKNIQSRSNFWVEVDEGTISTVKSENSSTGVCLARLIKQ